MKPEDAAGLRQRLFAAVQLYRERVQEVPPPRSVPVPAEHIPALIAAMRRAVDTGQPLREAAVSRIAGSEPARSGSTAGG